MYPLIEITTVPIELEMKSTPAHLEYSRGTAEMKVSRDKGGLSINSRPIRVNIDTFEARNSISPTPVRSIEQNARAGMQTAQDAAAAYAQQGKRLLSIKVGEELVTEFAQQAQTKNLKMNVGLQFLPTTGPEITWDKGGMNLRYEMDKLKFDWRTSRGDFEFIPGDVEISVSQQPDVIIKYVGGPMYVPPSAEPGAEPPKTGE